MAIAINAASAQISVGASADFVFSGKTGAEYFVDITDGADKCTLTKINSTTWRVTRTAVGNITIRGSESPYGDNVLIGGTSGQLTLREAGKYEATASSSNGQAFSAINNKLAAVDAFFEFVCPTNSSAVGIILGTGYGSIGSVAFSAGEIAKVIRKAAVFKVYRNGVFVQDLTIPAGAENNTNFYPTASFNPVSVGTFIARPSWGGVVTGYSEALANIGIPPQPINIAFDVPASVNVGDVLVPDNQTTNATGYEWRVNNVLRSTAFEPDLSQWLVIGNNSIKLTATNPAYTEHLTKNVTLLAPGTVEFQVPDIEKGKSFSITNQSTNTNTFSIDYGDGVTSNNPNLPHTYAEVGAKIIMLTGHYANNITISKAKEIYVFPSGYAWLMEELRTKTQSNIFPLLTDAEIKTALKNAVETDEFGNVLSFWENRANLVNKLAADLWMIKAAKASAMIETANTQEGLRNSNEQIYEHCLEMAEKYRSKDLGTVNLVNLSID